MPRVECPECGRPQPACYCQHVKPVPTRTKVVILQHPREARVAINTARIARLCLPNAEIRVGIEWREDVELAALMSDPEREPILLYPGEGAKDITTLRSDKPVTLVVIDGTWSQSRAVLRSSPALAKLPRYSFSPPVESEYRIRREPRWDFVSTIESLVHVLGTLEDEPDITEVLMRPFRAMVDFQLSCVDRYHVPRARVRPKHVVRRAVVPGSLLERGPDLVCVVGEANAWPRRPPSPYRSELVHWAAYRPHTGEQFECVLAPQNPVAPNTPHHVDLTTERLQGGCEPRAFERAWRSFAQDTDVVCSWGYFPISLLRRAGGFFSGDHVDLRSVAKQWSGRKWGSVAQFHEEVGRDSAPMGEGRAGRNLGRLAAVTRFLIDEGRKERTQSAGA
jgi:tRNA-uridine aminocarboxypropyltransferase